MNENAHNMGWKKYLLIGSLCVNVLVIGSLVGHALKPDTPPNNRGPKGGFASFAKALPADKRKELRKQFESDRSGFRKKRELSAAVREKMRTVISTVPFDKEALAAVFAEQRAVRAEQSVIGDQAWINLIASMSNQERADFVAAIQSRRKKRN